MSSKILTLAHAYNPSYSGSRDQEDLGSRPTQAAKVSPKSKIPNAQKRTGRVAQVVEHMPSKCKAEFKLQYKKKKLLRSSKWLGWFTSDLAFAQVRH
jgi:hypothetical protein